MNKVKILPGIIALRPRFFGAVVVCMLLQLVSCKKDALIKTGVQPEEDNVTLNFIDTLTINAYTYLLDSVKVDAVTTGVIGSFKDIEFGDVVSACIFQLIPGNEAVTFDNIDGVKILDAVFSIQPSTIYSGINHYSSEDFNGTLSFSLFPYDTSGIALELEKSYYNFDEFFYVSDTLASCYVSSLNFNNSTNSFSPLDFKLDLTYAKNLLSHANEDALTFFDNYEGFVLGLNDASAENNIVLLDLLSATTKLTIAYQDSAKNQTDTSYYSYAIGNSSTRINNFYNDFNSGSIGLSFNDAVKGKEKLYISDMHAAGIRLEIPHIFELINNDTLIINKAELVMPIIDDLTSNPTHIDQEIWLVNNADSVSIENGPFNVFNLAQISGTKLDDSYTFNITGSIQSLYNDFNKNKKDNFGYSLLSLSPNDDIKGTVFFGTNPSFAEEKLKLNITYSVVK